MNAALFFPLSAREERGEGVTTLFGVIEI